MKRFVAYDEVMLLVLLLSIRGINFVFRFFSKRAPVLVGAACYYSQATIRLAQVLVCARFQGNSCRPCALDENDDDFDDDDGRDEFLHFHSKIKKTELVCPPTKK